MRYKAIHFYYPSISTTGAYSKTYFFFLDGDPFIIKRPRENQLYIHDGDGNAYYYIVSKGDVKVYGLVTSSNFDPKTKKPLTFSKSTYIIVIPENHVTFNFDLIAASKVNTDLRGSSGDYTEEFITKILQITLPESIL